MSRVPPPHVPLCYQRRKKVIEKLKDWALLVGAQPESIRNGSVYHPYRPDSNLFYLTGFTEANTVLVINPLLEKPVTLFVQPKDLEKEIWDGFRFGPEKTKELFLIDQVYTIDELPTKLPDLLSNVSGVYHRFRKDPKLDQIFLDTLDKIRLKKGRTGLGYLPIKDANQFLGEFRVIKSQEEIEIQRQACNISAEAHLAVMRYVKPGMNEREIHGYFIYQLLKLGASREGYGTIVAGGANACTLHYVFNDQNLIDGQLLLLDGGGEYFLQTADITRTYPINGRWSYEQSQVYQGVLKIQKKLIDMVKPGVTWKELQDQAVTWLCELILDLGLLPGRVEDMISSGSYRKYYPHGVGHFLGLDVHDSGLYIDPITNQSRSLEPGMILTIEPGLYVPAHDESPFRGIGVRIEDDVLVTQAGHEVLTKLCPKDPDELSQIIGH
ncbi:MAG: aminopeptidase P family protein [Bdellovibrionaceae bacterium]|nr:aminopeptidase P family protein [Pseudobdellovibrionaceae bacterium]MDW8189667.1 aminopeptidase P family protein [Pseudobdellovibrionaceae bacterium]